MAADYSAADGCVCLGQSLEFYCLPKETFFCTQNVIRTLFNKEIICH